MKKILTIAAMLAFLLGSGILVAEDKAAPAPEKKTEKGKGDFVRGEVIKIDTAKGEVTLKIKRTEKVYTFDATANKLTVGEKIRFKAEGNKITKIAMGKDGKEGKEGKKKNEKDAPAAEK